MGLDVRANEWYLSGRSFRCIHTFVLVNLTLSEIAENMIATKSGIKGSMHSLNVPKNLIYEILQGKPIYYKGYRDVVAGTKKISDIMGSSGLQSFLVTYLILLIGRFIDDSKYILLSSEAGLHLDKRNNLAGDILLFEAEKLPIDAIGEHYIDVPPRIVIEVDIIADPESMHPDTYLFTKTQKLLDFGVEKVIWITTPTQKVTIATPYADWQVKNWNEDVEILDGLTFNIGKYLTSKGSSFA